MISVDFATCTTTPETTLVWKFFALADSVYLPGATTGNEYWPEAFVCAVSAGPAASGFSVTVVPGTTAPEGSLTMPRTDPVIFVVWLITISTAKKDSTNTTEITRSNTLLRFMLALLVVRR